MIEKKVAYHVQTQEDYDALMVELEEQKCTWKNDFIPTRPTRNNIYELYKDKTVIYVSDDNLMTCTNTDDFQSFPIKSIPLIEYRSKNKQDSINHSRHYQTEDFTTIKVIEAMLTPEEFKGYLKGNIIRYREQSSDKEKPNEDLDNAKFYWDKLKGLTK